MLLTERIKEIAEPEGLTFASIERNAGLGRGTIRKWDNNCPSADKLYKVANMLHVSMDYLMGNDFARHASLASEDAEWLNMIHQLPTEQRYELRGYIKRMLEESATAESSSIPAN